MTKLITNAHTAIFQWAKASASSLPTGSLRPNPNEFKYHEEHPKPVDQDALTGLSHIAPFSRADDPPGNVPFAPQP